MNLHTHSPTHTLSLVLSLSFLLYIWRTCWVSLSLVLSLFSSAALSWYLLIKIEFVDITWLKTLCLLMFGKVYIYSSSNTHPLTRSQVYPPSHKCDKNTSFLRVRYQVKRFTRTRSVMRYDIVPTLEKQIACGAGLRRFYKASAFKWLLKTWSQQFPQEPVLNTFATCHILFPHEYGAWSLIKFPHKCQKIAGCQENADWCNLNLKIISPGSRTRDV